MIFIYYVLLCYVYVISMKKCSWNTYECKVYMKHQRHCKYILPDLTIINVFMFLLQEELQF